MGRIPRSFIDDLLSRVNIVELIDSRVRLKKTGANYAACCPFHDEKSPSFTVSEPKQFYYCFGCGASGNAISFLMEYDRQGFVDAIETLASMAGVEIPAEFASNDGRENTKPLYDLLGRLSTFYQKQLANNPGAKQYLKQRGLSAEICERYAIGYAPEGWDNLDKAFGRDQLISNQLKTVGMLISKDNGGHYDRFRDRIMFPIRDTRGRCLGFGGRVLGDGTPKYLNSPETPTFHKGRELYGLHEAMQAKQDLKRILIVEGYMDVIALAQFDINNVVATLGTATTSDHLHKLFRYSDEVVFCFDGDKAGRTAAWRALENALSQCQDGRQLRFLFLPEGEDPDTFVRAKGKAAFEQAISDAMALEDFLFNQLAEQVNLNHIDGLAKFAKLASPLIYQIPPGVMQQKMLERLANVVRMEPAQLRSLTARDNPNANKPADEGGMRKRPPRKLAGNTMTPLRLAMALLLQNPSLAKDQALPEVVQQSQMPGLPLLCALHSHILQQPNVSAGSLLEHWRGQDEYRHLAKLAAWQLDLPEEGMGKEFAGAMRRVAEQVREQRIESLLTRANMQGLSSEEKTQLQELLLQSRRGEEV